MTKIIALILTCIVCVNLSACGGGEDSRDVNPMLLPGQIGAGDVLVYESRQSVQCGTRGLTTQQSASKLTAGGIDVVRSACGVITGVGYPTLCGSGTGEILMHEIRSVNLPDAEQRGFASAATLQDPARGISYAWVDCDTGVVIQ